MCERPTSLIGCSRQRATASSICKHRNRRSIVLLFSRLIFSTFQLIFAYLFRRVRSYDKEVFTRLFSDISTNDFRKFRGHNLAWNFHMPCASDGRLLLLQLGHCIGDVCKHRSRWSVIHSATLFSNFQHIRNNFCCRFRWVRSYDKEFVEGGCQPRAWYRCRYEISRVITSNYHVFQELLWLCEFVFVGWLVGLLCSLRFKSNLRELWHRYFTSVPDLTVNFREVKVRNHNDENLPLLIARLWFKISSPYLAVRQTSEVISRSNICMKYDFDNMQDSRLVEVCTLWVIYSTLWHWCHIIHVLEHIGRQLLASLRDTDRVVANTISCCSIQWTLERNETLVVHCTISASEYQHNSVFYHSMAWLMFRWRLCSRRFMKSITRWPKKVSRFCQITMRDIQKKLFSNNCMSDHYCNIYMIRHICCMAVWLSANALVKVNKVRFLYVGWPSVGW